jgi:pimeloyl-ACP methyl ester carboxylesterase
MQFLATQLTEGGTGTTLRLSRPAAPGVGYDFNLSFLVDGVATPAVDYAITNLVYPLTNSFQKNITVTIPGYALQVDIPVRALADNLTEGYESLYARLDPLASNYTPDTRSGSQWMASLNIRDTNTIGTATPLDSDGDGMSDSFENANGTNPYVFNDPYADSDGDGMSDVEEAAAGTNPHARDSDGDGLDDYTEWTHGSNPADAAQHTLASAAAYARIKLASASCYKCHQTTLNAGQYQLTSVPPIRGHTTDSTRREQVFQFLKGQAYPVQITGPVTADTSGQYTAEIEAVDDPPGFFVDDPQGMLGSELYVSNLVGKAASVIVPQIALAVDNDADGQIRFDGSDQTATNQPYRFWLNDDNDQSETENLNSPADYANLVIDSKRDLEDLTRLAMNVGNLAGYLRSNQMTLRLEWRSTSGAPAINLYRMADTNGTTSYLTDDLAAAAQTNSANNSALVSLGAAGTNQFTFATNFWSGLSGSNATRTLLFEGAGEGSGQLVLSLIRSNVVVAESSPLSVELKNIKKMYERATATPDDNAFAPPYNLQGSPLYTSQPQFQDGLAYFQMDNSIPFERPAGETPQCVVFIHGWNMEYNEYLGFSETMFKRLWWQGFKGRFCAFRWATLTSFNSYNTSEFRAWKYGESLRQYGLELQARLPDYAFNLVAHSMGNVVAGSALQRGLRVNNYVLMQAAVPAGCYDTSTNINSYSRFTQYDSSSPTPDLAADMGYRGYLTNVTGNLVNFFNTNDFALATGTAVGYAPFLWWLQVNWEANQESYKPDSPTAGASFLHYKYNPLATANQRSRLEVGTYGFAHYVTDPHEMLAFVARPRSKAVGAKKGVGGTIDGGEIDLTSRFNFRDGRDEHSAEFNWRMQQLGGLNGFYFQLATSLQVLPPL